ncbi:hypothetical protein EIQ06_04975 [Xanthomonas campestris pv. campestris]|nr:hypothetical protein AEA01_12000 [Xanthomonas campestris pv. campestris]ALE68520.1 hypothetical protein AAW18_08580 [Xanthomonas campestris pv. campestris]QCX67956.1 hypothetical protein DFG55_17420 [Xanthomonas campestris pv. campestris]QCX71547.1 hypothetical protein DFG54_13005 [Xanthomonas campestris pv. campestris]RFF48620.1 hypothetical protein D0A42_06065 [Xanthomonas campestris pv. campestris]
MRALVAQSLATGLRRSSARMRVLRHAPRFQQSVWMALRADAVGSALLIAPRTRAAAALWRVKVQGSVQASASLRCAIAASQGAR